MEFCIHPFRLSVSRKIGNIGIWGLHTWVFFVESYTLVWKFCMDYHYLYLGKGGTFCLYAFFKSKKINQS